MRDGKDRRRGPRELDDAELAARLSGALRGELGRGHVDVAGLLRATRQETRRAKVRRRALVAVAAVAVLGIPVGVDAMRSGLPQLPGLGTPAAGGGPTGSAVPPPTAAPPSEQSRPTGAGTDPSSAQTSPGIAWDVPRDKVGDPDWQAYDIPDSIAFEKADLPAGMTPVDDIEPYRNGPTVSGQGCGTVPPNRWPLARREWHWGADPPAGARETQVNLVVTGWNRSEDAFNSVVGNTGACRLLQSDQLVREESPDSTSWLSERTSPEGLVSGYAVRRLPGEVIVAVTVVYAGGAAEASRLATELMELASSRTEAAAVGIPEPGRS